MKRLLRSVSRLLGGAARAGSLGVLVAYFALSMAYVAPVNPVKLSYHPLLMMTIGSYFSQNWSLFAPNPISSNNMLLAKCLDANADANAPTSDDWRDLSTPLARAFQHNRFSAYDRAARPISNSLRQFTSGGPELWSWQEGCRKGSEKACQVFDSGIATVRRGLGQTLGSIGSAFCNTRPDAASLQSVVLRMRAEPVHTWALRDAPTERHRDFEIGTFPIDHAVTPMSFLRP